MKLPLHTALVTAVLTVAGCTSDSGYDGCHGTGCLVDNPGRLDRTIDSRPQFDRQGNPNFDTRGNYIGCHGVGCQVDSPDDAGSSNDVDDRPQFDREGNPNFDTQGNYQGCHGIGCEVDTPDDGGSSDDDSDG